MKQKLIVYWSRRDFRLRDNRALLTATETARQKKFSLLPIFIIEPYMTAGDPKYQFGLPSRYFLSKALPEVSKNFKEFSLIKTKPVQFFSELAFDYEIEIHVNEDVHPDFYTQVKKIQERGIKLVVHRDQLTVSKETRTGLGNIYSVFTPFKRAVWTAFVNEKEDRAVSFDGIKFFDLSKIKLKNTETLSAGSPEKVFSDKEAILIDDVSINIDSLNLPQRNLDYWYFTEAEALKTFKSFLKQSATNYENLRNQLDADGTSKMSLALAWGLVSARTLVKMIQEEFKNNFPEPESLRRSDGSLLSFISELIWREFYKYLFFHRPELFSKSFQGKYDKISWVPKKVAVERFKLWIKGETGYPVVDAAMMQLAQTGWMHNRARMIVSSVLTKNLGIDWRWGQEYFRAMLIDLDESSNNGGWQWGASVGADPKPIRIFNPYLQAQNYDPDGAYQNRWLTKEYLKNPPKLIIEHKTARAEAIQRYGLVK